MKNFSLMKAANNKPKAMQESQESNSTEIGCDNDIENIKFSNGRMKDDQCYKAICLRGPGKCKKYK